MLSLHFQLLTIYKIIRTLLRYFFPRNMLNRYSSKSINNTENREGYKKMKTKLVLLGTGTPNACPNANGPSSAVVVGDRAYIVDFGPGVVRQASAAYFNGIDALRPDLLRYDLSYAAFP